MRLSELQLKEIINISNGKRFGIIIDVIVSTNGNIEKLVLDDDILELEGIDNARENIWLHYKDNNNNPIPRVTHIIAQNRDQDYLIKWAANIGRTKYDFYRDKALEVGTFVHHYIDLYLESKFIKKDMNLYISFFFYFKIISTI